MAPPAGSAARRSSQRAQPRPALPTPKRPPLRIFEPAPRRKSGFRLVRHPTMWLSGILVVGSLLAVVAGDDVVTQGQIRLSSTQGQVASAVAAQKAHQVAVAQLAAPPRVVALAKSQGMVATGQVTDLPQVPLNVPLPVPQTAPLPTAATTVPVPVGTARGGSPTATPQARR